MNLLYEKIIIDIKKKSICTRNARQIAFKSRSLIDISDRSSVLVFNPSITVLNG
jgi:hypothetical protein